MEDLTPPAGNVSLGSCRPLFARVQPHKVKAEKQYVSHPVKRKQAGSGEVKSVAGWKSLPSRGSPLNREY